MVKCPHCQANNPDKATFCRRCKGLLQPDRFFQVADKDASGSIRLGYRANFFGQTYEVIGYLRYKMIDEEGEAYTWDEWRLHNPKTGDLWLVREDDYHFKLMQPYALQKPIAWSEVASKPTVLVDNRVVHIKERGKAKVISTIGDVEERGGKQVEYADGRGMDGMLYSFERYGEVAEVYKGKPISPVSVYEAFGMKAAAEIWRWKLMGLTGLKWGGVALMLIGLLAWLSIAFLPKGKPVLKNTFFVTLAPAGEVNATELPIGVFKLSTENQPYCLSVETDVKLGSWLFCQLVSEEVSSGLEQEVSALSHEFWEEQGYDEGEYWHERDEKRYFHFRVNQTGEYALSLYLESSPNLTSVPIVVSLYERTPFAAPLWIFGGFALTLGFIGWFTSVGGWQWLSEYANDGDE